MPFTNPYPGARSVLVLDNCNIHKTESIRALVEDEYCATHCFIFVNIVLNMFLGCKLIFLSPYSPDFNPIESAFSSIKAYLRRHSDDESFTIIAHAVYNITPAMASGWYRDAGYI